MCLLICMEPYQLTPFFHKYFMLRIYFTSFRFIYRIQHRRKRFSKTVKEDLFRATEMGIKFFKCFSAVCLAHSPQIITIVVCINMNVVLLLLLGHISFNE